MDNMTLGAAQALAKKLGADPELVTAAVEAWLDAHPEATTTVEDGSITKAKLDQILQGIVDDVPALKSAINETPMIAETDAESDLDLADPQGYVIARFENGHIKTKNFDSSVKEPTGAVEWKISGNDLLISYGYNATVDAVVVLNEGRANDLFDFAKFCTKPKGTPLSGLETADLTVVWTSGTDMHSPFQFNATTNPDGYYSDAAYPSFTGGNHKLTINGTDVKTASSKYVHYFADGKPVSNGYGKCSHFEIRWANNVQPYNCVKADGTGRTGLVEYHNMIFDGVRFEETITLVPAEEISMVLWYGLQSVSWGVTYTSARFIDATNRGLFISTDSNIKSGNAAASGIVEIGENHSMEMTVDIGCDLGKRTYYTGDSGAFISTYGTSAKGYFSIIGTSVTMAANSGYYLRGTYRFFPTLA